MTTTAPRRSDAPPGVVLRSLRTLEEMHDASALIAHVWQVERDRSLVSPELMVALSHSDNYVGGAFDDSGLVGVSIGFFHSPRKSTLHSHIAAVAPARAGAGIGRALKEHQRSWARERGAARVSWTFDPLIARNAYFNIRKLGCDIEAYLTDFYGPMTDSVNHGQPSDRLLVSWSLDDDGARTPHPEHTARIVLRDVDGLPASDAAASAHDECLLVQIPADIDSIRLAAPEVARRWRTSLREVLGTLLADGWCVVDFDRRSQYHLRRSTPCTSNVST